MNDDSHDQISRLLDVDDSNLGGVKLQKMAKRMRGNKPPPLTADPIARLRELVMQHRRLGKLRVANGNMAGDKKIHKGPLAGQIRKSPLAADDQGVVKELNKIFGKTQDKLKSEMHKELRRVPVYEKWLKNVAGVGPILAAYLLSQVNIELPASAPGGTTGKPSNLIRFCGNAVIDGKRDSLQRGEKAHYAAELRCQLFVWYGGLVRGKGVGPKSDKYLDVAANYANRMRHSERVNLTKNTITRFDSKALMTYRDPTGAGKDMPVSAKNFVLQTGRRKAVDVFLEDLYIVWRSLEGLPVWAGYYAEKLGYRHGGGKIDVSKEGPQMLTFEEALALVGDCSSRKVKEAPCVKLSPTDPDLDDETDD